jgi:hypothetical protein
LKVEYNPEKLDELSLATVSEKVAGASPIEPARSRSVVVVGRDVANIARRAGE